MAFWPFGKRKDQPAPAPAEVPAPPVLVNPSAPEVPELVRRARGITFTTPEADRLAAEVLFAARATPLESQVTDALLANLHESMYGEPTRVQIASILIDRGERERAEGLLEKAHAPAGLFMAAELAEARGDRALAVARLERVLARDVDYPGARERHKRLREALGIVVTNAAKSAGVTAMVPQAEAPYRLLREVARGGSGAVYEAEDPVLRRTVALKLLHDPAGQGEALLREMRQIAQLAGDGVIRVYDADADAGWLAFEWAQAGSLRENLRKGTALLREARVWVPRMCAGLARVHAAGFVHGDVKPANLLFLDAHTPVWSDFGLATPIGEELHGGSMGYMTPDRMRKTSARIWHDLYGIGRICEELATTCVEGDRVWLQGLAQRCLGAEADAPPSIGALLAE